MQQGKLLSVGAPKEITASFNQTILAVKADNMYALLKDLNAFDEVQNAYSFGEFHHAVMKENFKEQEFKNYLEQKNQHHLVIKKIEPSIEDSFMQLMKQ
jgi:ABC-type multidrug transport system ATPase subunit